MSEDLAALLRNPETPDYVIRDYILEMDGVTVANVYAVIGQTGEYSDRQTWTVAAFLDEEQANTVRDRLNKWCAANGLDKNGWSHFDDEGNEVIGPPMPPDDPAFEVYYTGTNYAVAAIPLRMEATVPS